jgi:hypothetical protein
MNCVNLCARHCANYKTTATITQHLRDMNINSSSNIKNNWDIIWINNSTTTTTTTTGKEYNNEQVLISKDAICVWQLIHEMNTVYHSHDWLGTKKLYLFFRDRLIRWRNSSNINDWNNLFQEFYDVYQGYTCVEIQNTLLFKFLFAYVSLSSFLATGTENQLKQSKELFDQLICIDLPELLAGKASHSETLYRKLMVLSCHCRAAVYSKLNNFDLELQDSMKAIVSIPFKLLLV